MTPSNPPEGSLPETAYYYPEPYWRMGEVDYLKSLLLFFDRVAILLPRYMAGREVEADPVLAGPMREAGLLQVLEPEEFVDAEMAQDLSRAMEELLEKGVFDDLGKPQYFAELSRSRMGWDSEVTLAKSLIKELRDRKLAQRSRDKLSVPLHPVVRTTILILLSQLARAAGRRRGLDLHPVTDDPRAIESLIATLSLPSMPSAGKVVALDLEAVSIDLASVPLDKILDFRKEYGKQYRSYMRDLRLFVAQLSGVEADDRDRLLLDRREELADRADELRRVSRRSLRLPLASVAVGAVGAVWAGAQGDYLTAALAFAAGAIGGAPRQPDAGAYSYLFSAQRLLPTSIGVADRSR